MIDLPYPRHDTEQTTPRFAQLKAQVTEDMRVETLRAVQMEKQVPRRRPGDVEVV